MRLIIRLFLLNLIFGAFSVNGQSVFQVSGKIVLNGRFSADEKITVSLLDSEPLMLDSTGFFNIEIPQGLNQILISKDAIPVKSIQLFITRDTTINIELKNEKLLKEVAIIDSKPATLPVHELSGNITLSKENIYSLPAMLGENDPVRAIQMQPGVQSGNEGARGVFIRGGSPDQTLMLIDGAAVYNASHIYGFLSVFNADAVNQATIYKDNYPARFGGRLGSVIDINTADGDTNLRGSFSLGIITSRFHLEGPFDAKKKTTFSLSLRGCYAGLFTSPISAKQLKSAGQSGDIAYYFGDVNAKIVHRFSEKTKLEVSFFTNSDFYSFKQESNSSDEFQKTENLLHQNLYWSNYVTSVSLVHTLSKQWTMKHSISHSYYQLTSDETNNQSQSYANYPNEDYYSKIHSQVKSYINDITWREEARFTTQKQTFRTGAGATFSTYETGKNTTTTDNNYQGQLLYKLPGELIHSYDVFMYAEDEYRPHERWIINGGVHARIYTVQQKTFVNVNPRLNVVYNPVKQVYLRVSASGSSQNLHLLASSSANILNDYWVPATALAKPEQGWNFSSGIMQKLPFGFEWSIDGFYRIMQNVIEYKDGTSTTSAYKDWETQIATGGVGRAYGTEVYFARSKGRITGSVAYTLAWSERKFKELNNGEYYPYKYDRRHNLAAQIAVHITRNFEIGLAYVYGSGNRFSVPEISYHSFGSIVNTYVYGLQNGYPNPPQGNLIDVFSQKNNARLPSYQHLDLSFTYRKRVKKLEHSFNLSIYNIYNHFNVFMVYSQYSANPNGTQTVSFKKVGLLPITPSISYTIQFSR
ncbi:MAG TPA: TonB-dependent receptor plug domain-containing protein [Chitinophagales bacterium]